VIDSHCHLADAAFAADLDSVVDRARQAGVTGALCILGAGDEAESAAAARVRAAWSAARFAVGVHPHHAGHFAGRTSAAVDVVRRAVEAEGALAIGEIGLDYHYDFSPRDAQKDIFAAQVGLALDGRLPVVVHTREATDDTFDILAAAGRSGVRGVFHCFTGDMAMARRALDIGFFLSFAGIVTFPRAAALRDIAKAVPADRLLVETDAPYLAPVPHRGRRNEPAYVARVAEVVAAARCVAPSEVAALVTRNFEALFGPNVSLQTA
jgi:TatD DNase family protein